MRRLLIAVASLFVVAAAACAPSIADPPGDAPLRYRDDVFTAVTKTSGITYASAVDQTGATVTLKLDMFQPTGDTVTKRPVIVWVHGGNFNAGDRTSPELVDEATVFGKKGFVSVSIDYRLAPTGCLGGNINQCITGINQAREDAQTAVRWLRTNAAQYKIDPDRIAIGGSSAGAITALSVGYSPENPGSGQYQGVSSAVRAVQSLSGGELASGPIDAGDAPAILF